jgi:hypothetical protein
MGHVRALNAPKCHDVTTVHHSARESCMHLGRGASDGDQETVHVQGERWPSSKSFSLYSEQRYHTIESEQVRTLVGVKKNARW